MGGALYLVPTSLSPDVLSASLPPAVQQTVMELHGFVAENARSARRFLKAIGYPLPLAQVPIAELNEHTPAAALPALLAPVRAGQRIGVLSEAGCPAVADPGAALIALAHREGLRVVPLVGPSSLLLALMASGLNGQRFCFHGYLPVEREDCTHALKRLESESLARQSTQIFIEAPYRNTRLLETILGACRDDTLLCLAAELTLPGEQIATKTVGQWRGTAIDLQRRPTVFLLQAVSPGASETAPRGCVSRYDKASPRHRA
jgi:16S rRNA (cytidine1402-2'-O)-methyltransferase